MKMIVMPLRSILAGTATVLLCATLAGCGGAGVAGDGVSVVASFYPLQYVAEQVGGDRVAVTPLTAPGVEPHDLELTPKQVGRLGNATVVVYEKGLQPAVDDAVEQNTSGTALDVSAAARLEDTGAHGQHEDAVDPHFWLDPARLADVAGAVAERLVAADPDGADGYRQRAADLRAQLTALDRELRIGLTVCARRSFVTSHEAFGYLAKRYGLRMVGVAGLTPDTEPSPARIKEVRDIVRRERVTTIFSEELASPKVAQSIARDLGVRTAVLSPVEGLADAGSADDYPSLMRANLRALRAANGCQ